MKIKMSSFNALALAAGISFTAHASGFTNDDAKELIFDFSRVATCSDPESPDEFQAVKIVENEDEILGQYGERFAVAWYGDMGCAGGTGTTTWHLSFVGVGMAGSAYVDLYQQPIHLLFLEVSSLSMNESGNIVVEGQRYDPREGSGKWDFVEKTSVISVDGKILESLLYIDGVTYPESELDDY